MIVHDIRVERGIVQPGDESTRTSGVRILVGATDEERWSGELEGGASGSSAKTLVCVELEVADARWAPVEIARLFVPHEDPRRAAAVAAIPTLFELSWQIHDHGWTHDAAVDALYGRRLDER